MKAAVKWLLAGLLVYSLHHATTSAKADEGTIDPVAGVAPLRNDEAETEEDCPPEGNWWHFVLTPNNGDYSFVSMDLNLGSTTITVLLDDMVLNGSQRDNVFVAVPGGFQISDLVKSGSAAVFEPNGRRVKFVLSHVCEGSTPSTTTTTTTTPPTTTSTTTTSTTSTTTTIPSTTTTTTIPSTTTTSTTPPSTTTTSTTTPETTTSTTTTVPLTTTTTPTFETFPSTTTSTTIPATTTTSTTTLPTSTTTPPTLPMTGNGRSLVVPALWLVGLGWLIVAARRRIRSI